MTKARKFFGKAKWTLHDEQQMLGPRPQPEPRPDWGRKLDRPGVSEQIKSIRRRDFDSFVPGQPKTFSNNPLDQIQPQQHKPGRFKSKLGKIRGRK